VDWIGLDLAFSFWEYGTVHSQKTMIMMMKLH